MTLALSAKTNTRLDCHDLAAGDVVAVIETDLEIEEFTELLANNQLTIKGKSLYVDIDLSTDLDDDEIGKVDTEYPVGNVCSLLRSGMLQASEHDAAPKPTKKKTPKQTPPAPARSTSEGSETTRRSVSEGPTTATPATTEPTAPSIDASFEGLDPAIALVLTKQSIATKNALLEYIESGKKLAELDEIGRSRVEKLNAWLAS